jgi:hypothetical protein
MNKERKSLAELGEEMVQELRPEFQDRVALVETTALLTVIREGLVECRTEFGIDELVGGVFDLTEPVLFHEEIYNTSQISHGKTAIWDLIASGWLSRKPDGSFKVSDQLNKKLLATLPEKNK